MANVLSEAISQLPEANKSALSDIRLTTRGLMVSVEHECRGMAIEAEFAFTVDPRGPYAGDIAKEAALLRIVTDFVVEARELLYAPMSEGESK